MYGEKRSAGQVDLFNQLQLAATQKMLPQTDDERIQICLDYFQEEPGNYQKMIQVLKSKVHLSESRLSHLFKDKVGLSLKKYLVWTRLKKTFHLVLTENCTMSEAALRSGFYDQAHLSKAFKKMLGLPLSAVYNSRTIQV